MDRERLDVWCERGILGLVLAILIYAPLATGAVRPQDFVVVEWMTLPILLFWGFRFWLNPQHRLLWPPVCWVILVFMLYAVARYLTSEIEFVARQELLKILVYGVLFFAILNNLYRLELTQTVALTVISLGMVISLYALYQFLADSDQVWHFIRPEIYRKRGSGTFISPNNLAGYLEMLLPLALTYTLVGRFGHLPKVFLGYASLVIFTGIAVTISRGSWAATALTMVILFIWLMRQRGCRLQAFLLLLGLASAATFILMTAKLSPNRVEKLTLDGHLNDVRRLIWAPAIQIWQDHFWWGAGPAHFDYYFRQYRPPSDQMQNRPGRAHNDYLNTLADWGLIGGVLVGAAWLTFYWGVFRSWGFVQRAQNDFAAKRSNKSSFVAGGALGLLAILFHSAVDYNMHVPANALLTVTLMALVCGHFRFSTERYWVTPGTPLRMGMTAALVAGSAYLGTQAWQKTEESVWLNQAGTMAEASGEQMVALQNAFAAEPGNAETAYKIGERFRLQAWDGGEGSGERLTDAMKWFKRAMELNVYDPYSFTRYGMCLHWLGKHAEGAFYLKRAYELDHNNHYIVAHLGWHYAQLKEWATAKKWFERSLRLQWQKNPMAASYLEIVNRKLAETPSVQ